jgi:hypothetical protein
MPPFGFCESEAKSAKLTANLEAQHAIEALARRLQDLPSEIRWIYTEQNVIVATAMGAPAVAGGRTTAILWLLRCAAKIRLDLTLAKFTSLALLAAMRCRQLTIPVSTKRHCFFVGINALREPELVSQFEAMSGKSASVIDQRSAGALASIYRPSTAELLRSWRDAAQPAFAALAEDHGTRLLDRLAVLAYVVRRLHHYAHFLAVFRGLNASRPKASVAFSTGDLPAYAALRAGIDPVHFPHGFLRRSNILPDFSHVVAFNAPDAEHEQSRLSAASVSLPPPVIRPLRPTRCLAVVGDYIEVGASSSELINFCRAISIRVAVRPHPADRTGYWAAWQRTSGVVVDRDGTFDEFIERHRPCVMATWYSTTVYDALLRGIVPVSFDVNQPDVVFPLSDVALSWPQQKERIQLILANPTARYESLAKALSRAIGLLYVNSAMKQFEALAVNLEVPA